MIGDSLWKKLVFVSVPMIASSALLWAPIVLFAALALVPFLDRSRYRSPMRRRAFIAIGVVVAIAAVLLVIYALVTAPEAHIMGGA